MKRPRIPTLRRLTGLPHEMDRRLDPLEAAEWEAIVREPFQPDARRDDAWSPGSAPAVEPLTPAAGATLPARNELSSAGPVAPTSAPIAGPTALTRGPAASDHPERRHRQLAGETAPDFLLRTPSGVSPIADDFFDGLIRRVEGDR